MTLKGVWNIVCGIALVLFVGFLLIGGSIQFNIGRRPERDSTVYVDTIPYYYPVPKDSIVLRYVTKTLPVVPSTDTEDPEGEGEADTTNDSANVILPVTQMVYEDSTYKAYVSGVYSCLDSIFVYPQKIVIRERKPPKRWSIGLGTGYGIGKEGLSPFVGISLQYKLFEF